MNDLKQKVVRIKK